jgi:hypothetical protein
MQAKIFFGFLFLAITIPVFSQGIAPNWTQVDCNSTSHSLYNYLDSQEVVVMEFVMGCSSCTDAGVQLMSLKNQYDVSHPGKVNFFLMDYYPSNTCVEVTNTWGSYNFDAFFSGCWAAKEAYYPTLYPMPAIVVAAGNYHTVIYNDLSWQTSDTTLIKQAIDHFFVTVGLEEEKQTGTLGIYPNPSVDGVYIQPQGLHLNTMSICLYNMLGEKLITSIPQIQDQKLWMPLADLAPGTYILEVADGYTRLRKTLVKN